METHALGPHSRPHMLAKLDRRTRELRMLVTIRAELTDHVGGRPSSVQKALIERCARLTLYIEAMDRDAMASGTLTERNSRQYLAWSNALRLALVQLGLKAAPSPTQTLAEYLKASEAEEAAAEAE